MRTMVFIGLWVFAGWQTGSTAQTNPSPTPQVQQTQPQKQAVTRTKTEDVIGEYYFGDGLGVNCRLKLSKEGRFSFTWHGCLGKYDENEGPWNLEDGLVVLKPTAPNVREGFRGTATRFYPIRWDDGLYLVSEDEMIDFCRAISLDWVFHGQGDRGGRNAFFYLRVGDENKQFKGMPDVPEVYKTYLSRPFSAKVIQLKDNGTFVIDRGRKHGVVSGTKLRVKNGDQFGYEVTSATQETADCVARSDESKPKRIKVGSKVSSFLRD